MGPKTAVQLSFFVSLFLLQGQLSAAEESRPNLILNGSFEEGPTCNPGDVQYEFAENDNPIPGWDISWGTIDYVCTTWPAADGLRSIDLNGHSQGAIRTQFLTTPGA